MIKHYIELLYPGALFTGSYVKEVDNRDPSRVDAPRECFGFRFFDREEVVSGNEVLAGNPKNYSGVFYFGRIHTLADVKREFPDKDILARNMEGNAWDRVVRTRRGNFQPLRLEDAVISED